MRHFVCALEPVFVQIPSSISFSFSFKCTHTLHRIYKLNPDRNPQKACSSFPLAFIYKSASPLPLSMPPYYYYYYYHYCFFFPAIASQHDAVAKQGTPSVASMTGSSSSNAGGACPKHIRQLLSLKSGVIVTSTLSDSLKKVCVGTLHR